MGFIENIKSQVHQRWTMAKSVWVEDDATRGMEEHEDTQDALERLYGTDFDFENQQVYVDDGDGYTKLYELGDKLILISMCPDGHEIREGSL